MNRKLPPDELRCRLATLVGFEQPKAAPEVAIRSETKRDGYAERLVSYDSQGEPVPALLLIPERPGGGGVVLHHQHHSQWHLGKSEVAGIQGDQWQAFGPELARRGVTVLAPDAIGFEDRRAGGPGSDPRPSDASDYLNAMTCRLVQGRPLMGTVLSDAATAQSVLCAQEGIDPERVGALGHSLGGATALFHAALDQRVRFALVSGAAATYEDRIARHVGIEATQVIPGVLELCDLDDIAALVAPRPMLLCSAAEDEYSHDAPQIAAAAAAAYDALKASKAFAHMRFPGGHALDAERFVALVAWVADKAIGVTGRGRS